MSEMKSVERYVNSLDEDDYSRAIRDCRIYQNAAIAGYNRAENPREKNRCRDNAMWYQSAIALIMEKIRETR